MFQANQNIELLLLFKRLKFIFVDKVLELPFTSMENIYLTFFSHFHRNLKVSSKYANRKNLNNIEKWRHLFAEYKVKNNEVNKITLFGVSIGCFDA